MALESSMIYIFQKWPNLILGYPQDVLGPNLTQKKSQKEAFPIADQKLPIAMLR